MLTCRSDIIFSGYSKLHLAEAGEVLGGDEGAVGEEAEEGRHHVQEGGPVRGQGGHEQRGIEPRQHNLGEEEVICMIINNAVLQSAEDVCDHLLGPQVQGAGHGHVEAVDVEHGQHGEGGLLLQPRRRQHELRVVAVERVAARHQVPLGQSHALR